MISRRILIFLIPAFIASLIYGYLQMPQQERVSVAENKSEKIKKKSQAYKSGTTKSKSFPLLRSDLLERPLQPYSGVRRNLFTSAFVVEESDEDLAALPEEPEELLEPAVIIPVAPPPPPLPTPQEVARKEISLYKFVGFFKKGSKQTIFLSTADEILLVRKGDYLGRDHKYYVLEINDTTLKLHKDGAGDFSIKLNDQESLAAVSLQPSTPPSLRRPLLDPETNRMDRPEILPVPEEEPQHGDQLQPEEDNNEIQN